MKLNSWFLILLTCVNAKYSISLKPPGFTFTLQNRQYLIPTQDGHFKKEYPLADKIRDSQFNAEMDVSFFLYKGLRDPGELIQVDNTTSLLKSQFDSKLDTRFVIHGWLGNKMSELTKILRDAYLAKGNLNCIVVDWSKGATLKYISSRNLVSEVGTQVGKFIEMLVAFGGVNHSTIYIVGHSLAGFAGKSTSQKIKTIFGLDPARPLFVYDLPEERLDYNDAEYVEVIHTAINSLGFTESIGHADFYVNKGNLQPGCLGVTCSHIRVVDFFAESISSNVGFWGVKCDLEEMREKEPKCNGDGKLVKMCGEPSNAGNNVFGVFFVVTNNEAPFAIGK